MICVFHRTPSRKQILPARFSGEVHEARRIRLRLARSQLSLFHAEGCQTDFLATFPGKWVQAAVLSAEYEKQTVAKSKVLYIGTSPGL
jgi:hypothetical protein